MLGVRRGLKLLMTGDSEVPDPLVEAWAGEPGDSSDGVAVVELAGTGLAVAQVPLCSCGTRGCGNAGIQLRKQVPAGDLSALVALLRALPWTAVVPTRSNVLRGDGLAALPVQPSDEPSKAMHHRSNMGKLFSYNITSPTAALRRALNRERSNVGRSAYTDRVKSILLACDQDDVIDALVADLQNYERGTQHDETQWLDVGLHACKQLNARRMVIFLTAFELAYAADFVQRARDDGYEIIVVPETIRRKLPSLRDALGNPIRDLDRYRNEWQDSFRFTFIDPADLSGAERAVWETLPRIFAARGGRPRHVTDVLVSETMRLMEGRYQEAVGVWEPAEGWIIVKRSQLQSLAHFAGTVLHELSHALSGAPDMSLEFEQQLTRELGSIVARNITNV